MNHKINKVEVNFLKNMLALHETPFTDEFGEVRPKYADGTSAYTKFVTQVVEKYDIGAGEFPLTQIRPIAWKSGINEILWIYQDQSNDLELLKNKYNISWWDEWEVDGSGTIGQRYGATVKKYDMMNSFLNSLKNSPFGRRHIMNLWQEADFSETKGLQPCAFMTMWSVRALKDKDGKLVHYLDMTLVQRSSDFVVSGSINKIQYVALMMMVAGHCGFELGTFVHFTQNMHIYDRHIEQMDELIERYEMIMEYPIPELILKEKKNFYDYTIDDFEVKNYNPLKPQLKFELAE